MIKKVLIIGSTGQLGYELQQQVPDSFELIVTDRSTLDLTNTDQIDAIISACQPDAVINAAAYTAVDLAESEEDLAYLINEKAPEAMARSCKALNIPFFHISTDFVFKGHSSEPYLPTDEKGPLSVYGASKLAGELAVQAENHEATIIRTSWVYSTHGNNFVKTMLRLMSERDKLTIVADQIGTPTYAKGLADMIYMLIDNPTEERILHYSDLGIASWYDFAAAIHQLAVLKGFDVKSDCTLLPIPSSDYPTPATRPSYSVMDKSILIAHHEQGFKHWLTHLSDMLDTLKQV